MQLLNRSGLAAIAAATALLSTPVLAQEATPAPAEPAPIAIDVPPVADSASTTAAPATTADPLAPATTTTTTTAEARSTGATRPTRASTAPARRASAPVARTSEPAAAAPTAAAPLGTAAATDAATPPVDPAMVAPLPETVAPEPTAPIDSSLIDNDVVPIAGAAGLGLLALAGAGVAMRRRRRRHNDEVMGENTWHEPVMSRPAPEAIVQAAPVVATAPGATSAFSWGSTPSAAVPAPINRIEAAKRGPTPDNPSLSLKKRLKRAAFFDQRDRQIAAGKAAPVPATAGLPERMAETVSTPSRPVTIPAHGMSMSFGKTFQPA